MATSRISTGTALTSSKNDRRQVQARIRALQQRSNALYEELHRSSSVANSAVYDIERSYETIIKEFQDQRDQLLRRIHTAKQNIQQSTNELNGIRKHLTSAKTFHLPPTSSARQSNELEIEEMNAMVDDIERELNNIAQQLKQHHFKPSRGHAVSKNLGKIQTEKNLTRKQPSTRTTTTIKDYHPLNTLSIHKLYTIDLDMSAEWIVSSIEGRIFLCDNDGEVRIYSYSRRLRRQPLLTERFHLSITRLITTFTVTHDYLIAFEIDIHMLTLHTHHGALMRGISFPYDPIIITHSDYLTNDNSIWICSRTKRQCLRFNIDHTIKDLLPIEQLDFKHSGSNILIDPVGISTDDHERIGIHDVNATTSDRLLIFSEDHMIVPLDFIKYADKHLTSRIDKVLLVPKQPNIIVLVYAPQSTTNSLHEIVIVDIGTQPHRVLYRLTESNGIRNIDLTLNGEIVFSVTPPSNKRTTPKMHIYSLLS